jgi:hypothetical protein
MSSARPRRASYAVIWRRRKGPQFAGRLELTDSALRLEGLAPGHSRSSFTEIPIELVESATVTREQGSRLRNLPTLTLAIQGAAPIQVATVDGPGKLSELAARLTSRLVGPEAA